MSAEIIDVTDRVLSFRISGQLAHAEFAATQKQAAQLIQQRGKVRFLVLIEDFIGMEKEGDWGNISFQVENDPSIEKIAIVGDKKWEEVTLLFTGKGVRKVPIEYFLPADAGKARTWLSA